MSTTTAATLVRSEELVRRGNARAAVELMTAANRAAPDPALEAALVQLRYDAWREVAAQPPLGPPAPPAVVPATPDGRMPEVAAADLDAGTVRAAIEARGGLIVRGLLSPEWCERLRDAIDRSWAAIRRYQQTGDLDPAWFHPIDTDAHGLTMAARQWGLQGGTSFVPDSPRLLFDLLEAFEAAHVRTITRDYFGEPPALSLMKVAHRRLPPTAKGGWHQDAAVYGVTARTLNFWVPVSRCGDVAPGLDLWPHRLDSIVQTTGTEGVAEFTADPATVAAMMRDDPPVRPVFEAGDAVLFDQWLLHQTAASPDYTERRYGFECWLFAPSTYPDPQRFIPLAY